MKRIAALVLLAAIWPGAIAHGADPHWLPTIPQVPSPDGQVIAAGHGERVLVPIRERIGMALPTGRTISDCTSCGPTCGDSLIPGSPVKGWLGSHTGEVVPCGSSVCAGSPIKAWLCYRPTAGHALPLLNPHPYVGPITGQFPCQSGNCGLGGCGPDGCGAGGRGGCGLGGCASGTCGGRGLFGRKGCGFCTLPSEGSFTGYRFANPEQPTVVGQPGSPPPLNYGGYGGYGKNTKPAAPANNGTAAKVAPAAAQAEQQRSPTVVEALKRNFGRQ